MQDVYLWPSSRYRLACAEAPDILALYALAYCRKTRPEDRG